jgi:hypothetical protein
MYACRVPVRSAGGSGQALVARRSGHANRGGDSVLIIHEDPFPLRPRGTSSTRSIRQPVNPDCARASLRRSAATAEHRRRAAGNRGRKAILCASRVEPHVFPTNLTTGEFRQVLIERSSLWRTTKLETEDGGERFNVRKDCRSRIFGWNCFGSSSDVSCCHRI